MWEVMPFYTRCYERRPCFVRGDKPKELAEIARITERQWASYQTHIQRESPILTGLRYLKVFEQESVTSYAKAAAILGVSRVRVFQLASLVTKLPKEITDYLVQNNDNTDIRRHFTERRLRPLVSLPTQDDQITQFKEMLTDLHPEQPVLTPEQ